MKSRIVKVVKYFFDNGNLTVDQIKRYVVVGTLTVDEFKAITGEDYVAEHLEAKAKEANEEANEEAKAKEANEEANDDENEESSNEPTN